MAVFNSFTFDGQNSLNYGVYISGEAVYNAPERSVQMVTIPGRNGTLAIDQGRFENIEVTYPAGLFSDTQPNYAADVQAFRNMLASRYSYAKLTDTYHTDEFRLGLYKSGLDVSPALYNTAGEFGITFDCKPQRFLMSGEFENLITPWGTTTTDTGTIVTFIGTESTGIKSISQSGTGSVHRTGKNLFDPENVLYHLAVSNTQMKCITYVGAVTVYIPCKPSTQYTISKKAGQRFIVASTANKPASQEPLLNELHYGTATSLTITTDASANYLCALVWLNGVDTCPMTEMLDSIQIELGATATAYEPYVGETYTLPAEITTLVGTNNIWADTGTVTVDYGDMPGLINPTMFSSKPLIKTTGYGTVKVNDTTITITGTAGQVIYIDCNTMEIYKLVNGEPTTAASLVSFSTNEFPELTPGANKILYAGHIAAVTVTPRWWRI